MPSPSRRSSRVIIVGGGLSGLATAMRLAETGHAVTLFEQAELGARASTRNQGWLRSGADLALDQPALSRLCHQGLRETIAFCPECIEPAHDGMFYLLSSDVVERWQSAWTESEIPFSAVSASQVLERAPYLEFDDAHVAFRLPDRSIRVDLLLRMMMEFALRRSVELRLHTGIARLLIDQGEVFGVETSLGEQITASLVVLAANVGNTRLVPELLPADRSPVSNGFSLAVVKTHLMATAAGPSTVPLCVLQKDGFHCLPHSPGAVVGTNRWQSAHSPDDVTVDPAELERLRELACTTFPGFGGLADEAVAWTETTVQAYSIDDSSSATTGVAWPIAIDHAKTSRPVQGLISAFAGRATLWSVISEAVSQIANSKIGTAQATVAPPPWDPATATTETADESKDLVDLYHCQKCGRVSYRLPGLEMPTCCNSVMVRAAQSPLCG